MPIALILISVVIKLLAHVRLAAKPQAACLIDDSVAAWLHPRTPADARQRGELACFVGLTSDGVRVD